MQIEDGQALRTFELGQVAEALGSDLGVLARGELRSPRRSVARFRSASRRSLSPSDLRLLSLASELGRMGGRLTQLLGRDPKIETLKQTVPVAEGQDPWRQGYRLAEAARRACQPATGPIVDLQEFLSGLGVHVAHVAFADRHLEAASLWEPEAVPVILINTESLPMRRTLPMRAALAHELCHLLHDSGERDLTTQLSWDESGHGGSVEQRARAFGPAFLAPPSDVKSWIRRGPGRRLRQPEAKVAKLAERWGLSYYGAIWHAKNCGLIRSRTADELAEEKHEGQQPWAENFEAESSPTPSAQTLCGQEVATTTLSAGLISRLAIDAAELGTVSEGRAREILAWGREL